MVVRVDGLLHALATQQKHTPIRPKPQRAFFAVNVRSNVTIPSVQEKQRQIDPVSQTGSFFFLLTAYRHVANVTHMMTWIKDNSPIVTIALFVMAQFAIAAAIVAANHRS